ncbi:MAG: RidA family protein [Achromobacter sp.]
MSTDPTSTQDSPPMSRHVIIPPTGLLPHRPYSPAVLVDRLLFVSGHTGSDPVTRAFSDDITEQTELALRNIRSVVEAAGGSMADVAKTTVFMTDMEADFQAMNAVFKRVFPDRPPARSTVGVAHLARPGLKVEIEAVAVIGSAA